MGWLLEFLPFLAPVVAAITIVAVSRKGRPKQLPNEERSPLDLPDPQPEEPAPEEEPETPSPPESSSESDSRGANTTPNNTQTTFQDRLERALDQLTAHLPISSKLKFTGYRVVDERAIGRRMVEAPIPLAGHVVRPIRGVEELDCLLPEELAFDDDAFYLRVFGTGEALVQVPVAYEPIMEPVHEEVYEEVVQYVYFLLDISPSMFERYARWRPPVWRGLATRILSKAKASQANVMLRFFWDYLGSLREASTEEEFQRLIREVQSVQERGGTNIGRALMGAIADMVDREFDEAVIIIVTDGEDSGFNWQEVRSRLDHHGVELHALMLGVENHALRRAADLYQIIEEGLAVHPPVFNKPQ